jgi:hypothetical protein
VGRTWSVSPALTASTNRRAAGLAAITGELRALVASFEDRRH